MFAHHSAKPVDDSCPPSGIAKVPEPSVERAAQAETAMRRMPDRPLQILLGGEDRVTQTALVSWFQQQGHGVSVVENGPLVLEALERVRFDAILMDIQMPLMNGYQVTKVIRDREQVTGQHVPVIAMIADAMKGDREICLGAGMDDFLSKPIDLTVLGSMIKPLQALPYARLIGIRRA
jgi:CheY-like chemotaxis protein